MRMKPENYTHVPKYDDDCLEHIDVHFESDGTIKDKIVAFETDIRNLYEQGRIKAPVHLSGGNEDQLINIFKNVSHRDWIFTTYRNHYHALLKGLPFVWIRNEILEKRGIGLTNPSHRFYSSAMVGGTLSMAVGAALSISMEKPGDRASKDHVWAFCGDMAAETGTFHESTKYAARHNLPITFVVEDNKYSVYTDTKEAWGNGENKPNIIKYTYDRIYPHHGHGGRIAF